MTIELIEPRCLSIDASIRQAFELLAGTFGMVITILDGRERLHGIVSDGDLRNALLSGKSIETPLVEVMNSDPVTITLDKLNDIHETELLRRQLEKRGVESGACGKMFAIPVVDIDNRIAGLTTLEILGSLSQSGAEKTNTSQSGVPSVLVVGGAGYIGSVLVEKIIKRGWMVKVLDDLIYSQTALNLFQNYKNFSFIKGDVCNLNTQVDAIQDVDCVVFLAEIVGDPSCQYVPAAALKTNYLAVNSMAALCSHMHISRFIYTSSCSVYGASLDPNIMLDEKSELNPVSHYARMKIASEEALFNQTNPLFSPTILRLGTVFGISHRPRFDLVVNAFAKDAYTNGVLNVNGGSQWRPNVHVADVGDTIIRFIEAPIDKISREVFNVGSEGGNYTIGELADVVAELYPGCRVEINESASDLRNYRVNFDKLNERLGYEPKLTIRYGVEELKLAFETELITNLDSEKYSNIKALKEQLSLTS